MSSDDLNQQALGRDDILRVVGKRLGGNAQMASETAVSEQPCLDLSHSDADDKAVGWIGNPRLQQCRRAFIVVEIEQDKPRLPLSGVAEADELAKQRFASLCWSSPDGDQTRILQQALRDRVIEVALRRDADVRHTLSGS